MSLGSQLEVKAEPPRYWGPLSWVLRAMLVPMRFWVLLPASHSIIPHHPNPLLAHS